jgi:hypothetical protein
MQLVNTHFKAIAKELKGEDPYQYMKAYSAGEWQTVSTDKFENV